MAGYDIPSRSAAIYEWVRQVRGGVLSGAFTVERNLSACIIFFMLGDRNLIPEVEEAFDDGLLSHLTFDRRISVAMLVAPHFLSPEETASLKSDLTELRTVRNAMAHHPFWFQPILNEGGELVELMPVMRKGKGVATLTTKFVEGLNARITGLIQRTAGLSEKVRQHERSRVGK